MKNTLRLFVAIATLALLAACGNKGPLMHPAAPVDEMPVPSTVAPPPASTAAAAPVDATAPSAASTAPAMPAEPMPSPQQPAPPANGGG